MRTLNYCKSLCVYVFMCLAMVKQSLKVITWVMQAIILTKTTNTVHHKKTPNSQPANLSPGLKVGVSCAGPVGVHNIQINFTHTHKVCSLNWAYQMSTYRNTHRYYKYLTVFHLPSLAHIREWVIEYPQYKEQQDITGTDEYHRTRYRQPHGCHGIQADIHVLFRYPPEQCRWDTNQRPWGVCPEVLSYPLKVQMNR